MKQKYDLVSLIETFSDHAKKADASNQENIIKYRENYSGEKLPDHMQNNFNICYAFLEICKEIKLIKEKIEAQNE